MPITQVGTGLQFGGQATAFASYIVETDTTNEVEGGKEDTFNADGSLANRAVFYRWSKVTLNLIAKTGAIPATDFPPENLCAATGAYSGWWVDSAPIVRSKSPTKITVTLTNIGISTVVT
jgi:hypothetical protein